MIDPAKNQLFESQAQVIAYLKAAAANPEFHWTFEDDRCLDYRKLTPQVGVSCYIHCADKILLLERSDKVACPRTWSTVSGYIDKLRLIETDINIFQAHLLEELVEEVGWTVDPTMQLAYGSPDALIKPGVEVHFELFTLTVPTTDLEIQLNDEHLDYCWVDLAELATWDDRLIPGFRSGLAVCGLG
ncbi:NUDIX domain-containing protein [filamentous cyanobacterium LEGE 11480]|uniref:NUDIX domain-containing protein n=1 Tax=Romeriopsis navalis LEGE 11480 TaxID=2777977 RepID=A0A928VRC1_9CYAN|nr:NUDIX domain-containing protein [Romeriopsis navalis]MBE9033090.1 NUDIX domain-containing protein [Romeriopsis navalis LEGE 11480]